MAIRPKESDGAHPGRSLLAGVLFEMLEAAWVDGPGLLTAPGKVLAPVVMPGIATAALSGAQGLSMGGVK